MGSKYPESLVYLYFACLTVKIKKSELNGPKYFVGPQMTTKNVEFALKKYDFQNPQKND